MQDNDSKYCIAVPIPDLKTTTITHAVAETFFAHHGAPGYILTDNEGSFISKLMKHLERLFNVKQLTTSAYQPQTIGSLERNHDVLCNVVNYVKFFYLDQQREDQA